MSGGAQWAVVCPLCVVGPFDSAAEAGDWLAFTHCQHEKGAGAMGQACRRPLGDHAVRRLFEKSTPLTGTPTFDRVEPR